MIRRILRKMGRKCHEFRYLDRHYCRRECVHCGEEQQEYMWWVRGWDGKWWETTSEGDGSCKEKKLPVRGFHGGI